MDPVLSSFVNISKHDGFATFHLFLSISSLPFLFANCKNWKLCYDIQMRLEHYPIEKLKKEILDILAKHLDLAHYWVFFFGSRVTGGGDERSDIDVGIEGSSIQDHVWHDIREAFENFPMLYKIEIVDFNRVASDFKDVALQKTEDINSPEKTQ